MKSVLVICITNSTQYSIITYTEEESEKNEYVYNWIILRYTWTYHNV